jgi:hypothetical protein
MENEEETKTNIVTEQETTGSCPKTTIALVFLLQGTGSVFSMHAQMVFKFSGCLVEKNNYKFSACFFENS